MLLSFQRPPRLSWRGLPPSRRSEPRALSGGPSSIALARRRLRTPAPAPAARSGDRPPRGATSRTHGRCAAAAGAERRAAQAPAQAAELALADLQDARRRARSAGTSSVVRRQRLAVELARRPGRAAAGPPSARRRTRRRSARAGAPAAVGRRATTSSISSGISCCDEDAVEVPPRPRPRPPAPWKRATSARASARLASRGASVRRAAARPSSSPYHAGHRRVGDAQRLAVHLLGRLGDPDLVAERLRHLPLAVDAGQQRHRQDDLLAAGRRRAGRRGPAAG